MPANEHVSISLDEVISEITTILGRGYMRHRGFVAQRLSGPIASRISISGL